MATRRWLGTAQDVAQVDTCTAALTWATGDLASISVGAVTITVTVGTSSATTDVVAAMTAAVNGAAIVGDETRNTTGDLHPETSWITASTSGSTCILTGDAAGRPFTATLSSTTAGDGTWVLANTTVATGKNWWTNVDNWSGATLPVNSDVIVADNGSVSILYGIDISGTALSSAKLHITRAYSGQIGLPATNSDVVGSTYSEYRDQYLKTDIGTVVIGAGKLGSGSGLIRIDHDTNACDISIHHTGSSAETGKWSVMLANNDGGTVYTYSGSIGVDAINGQASPDVSIRTGYDSSVTGDAVLFVGPGAVVTTCICNGGTNTFNAASVSSITHDSGVTEMSCTPITTAIWSGGTVDITSDAVNGTIAGTTWTSRGAAVNCNRALHAITLVNPWEIYGTDSTVVDTYGHLSTPVFDLNQDARVGQLTLGKNLRVTIGTPA